MPGVVDRVAAAERAGMFANDPPVLADHDAAGISMNLDGTPLAATEYLLLSKRTKQVFDTGASTAGNPSNRPA
jgi:hypothetical protein